VLSLRDKSHSPIEAPHNYLSAYDLPLPARGCCIASVAFDVVLICG
jgi:hypothetical protein